MASPSPSPSPSNGDKLLKAAFDGNLKLLKRLVLELGSYGDGLTAIVAGVRNSDGRTALHSAAEGGKTHVCKYLIKELKLDVNIKDEQGETPLHHATVREKISTATYLLENGANPIAANDRKVTALHYAAEKGHKKLLLLLISKGAVVDAEAPIGTPLHWASIHGKKEAVKTLLENNANVNKKIPNKLYHDVFSPLKVALLAKSSECAKLLLEAGADPNIQSSGVAALQIAASQGETEMIKCLLQAGANPNVNDYHGLTPVEVAALRGNTKDVMILFPVTFRISNIPDWSPCGIMKYINSTEATELKEYVSSSKSKGNEAFAQKDYHYAIYWYSEAINSDPTDAALLSNRSLCRAKLKDGTRALLDAQACLSLRPDWPKAYYREGVAWNLLKQYHRAAIVFSNGLKLDPENEELQTAFWEAEQNRLMSLSWEM